MRVGVVLVISVAACSEPEPRPTATYVDRVREELARRCQSSEADAAPACVGLGEIVAADKSASAVAESWYQLGCQKGSMRGCGLLGGAFLMRGEAASAVPVLTRACDGGDAVGCFNLAWILAAGQSGVAADPAKAAALYERACEEGLGVACQNRGWMAEQGLVGAKDARAAADWYGRGCQADTAASCTTLGLMTRDGRGVPADRLNARTLLARGCQLGDPAACEAERSL